MVEITIDNKSFPVSEACPRSRPKYLRSLVSEQTSDDKQKPISVNANYNAVAWYLELTSTGKLPVRRTRDQTDHNLIKA
jgi:hypothetical protein